MTYVLRKSYGAYSAGTRVELMGELFYVRNAIVGKKDDEPVPAEFVVKRRSMTRMVPTVNSRQRRKDNKRARQLVLGLAASNKPHN